MSKIEQGNNRAESSALVDQERGALSKWLTVKRAALLAGAMIAFSGGLAEASKNKAELSKEKPAATSVEKKDGGAQREVVRDVKKERDATGKEFKTQTEAFVVSVDQPTLDVLKKQGVVLSGNTLILRGIKMILNAVGDNGTKTIRVEFKTLPDGTVETKCFNSDKSRDIAIIADGKVKSIHNIAPEK